MLLSTHIDRVSVSGMQDFFLGRSVPIYCQLALATQDLICYSAILHFQDAISRTKLAVVVQTYIVVLVLKYHVTMFLLSFRPDSI